MSYFVSQEVRNLIQLIKYVKLSSCPPILTHKVTLVESFKFFFTFKPFIDDFYKFRYVIKWKRYSYVKLLIMLEYRSCCLIYAESDRSNFVDPRCFICVTLFSAVDNNLFILNN